MPTASRNSQAVRNSPVGRISRVAPPPTPSIEAQCRAVVARLGEITAPDSDPADDENGARVDAGAVASLPDPTGWGGRAIVPWGHPQAGGHLSRNVEAVRAGRSGWYLQYNGALYDTVRDAFVAARLNKPVSAPWSINSQMHDCGCLTVRQARPVAIEGTIDVDAQLELMRGTLKHVALAAPQIDLGMLADDLFAGQRVLAEHYLWRLETDGFVDHAGDERQTSLMLTAEGCSVLLMLEVTPGVNGADKDLMSPQALAEAAATDEAAQTQFESRRRFDALRLDVPRFPANREPAPSEDRMVRSTAAQHNTQQRSFNGQA